MPACADPHASIASPADWQQVFALLDVALELAPAAQAGWFESLDAKHARLAPLLKELLQAHADVSTGGFLQTPANFAFAGPAPEAPPGLAAQARVGPYRLLREIGEGGMASVWLAERADGLLERQVALKLPHVSWGGAPFAERMARERNILASLTHANIARLYDAGVADDGRPFLALEYVDGQPIDGYASACGLGVRARLELILQVAHAVAHAHARLVVHRDLKPSNILVDAQGQAHLLDFGIAKLIDPLPGDAAGEPQLTQAAGGRALTPDYASPEQIRGEPIGTASDVYSLGVVAYELLAEVKPYRLKGDSAAGLAQAIAALDVPRASVAAGQGARRELRGDLDAILNKALKKDIADRYASVEAFAQDIERHLANQPVQARPDAPGYRIRKFLRRNKLPVAAAAAIGVSLIAGFSVAMWQAREALVQADRAEQVKQFMLSIFADSDTDSGAGNATTAADLLRTARQRVSHEMAGPPELAVELMTALGYSLIGQGLHAESAALMRDAVDLSLRQLGPRHVLTGAAQVVQGEALLGLGQNNEAITVLSSGVEAARRSGDLRTLNNALRHLSEAQLNEGQVDAGVESARLAVATLSARGGAGKPQGPREVMFAHIAYANALVSTRRAGAAEAARRGLSSARAVYGQKTTEPVLAARTLLAVALVAEGQLDEGLREIDTLVPAAIELLGPHHAKVSKIASLVGSTKLNAGDVSGAIAAFRISLAIDDALGGAGAQFQRGLNRFILAGAYAAARRSAEALPLLDEAVDLLKTGAGPDNLMALRAASARAWQLAEAGRLADADAAFRTLESAPWTGLHLAAHQGRLAILRGLQGRHADALELAERASQVLREFPNKSVQARALALLGTIRLDAGEAGKALEPLQAGLALYTQVERGVSPDHADVLVALGRSQLLLGDVDAAALSLAAADRFWQAFDAKNRRAGLVKLHLAQALWTRGDKLAAAQALRQADAVLGGSAFPADHALLRSARQRFAS